MAKARHSLRSFLSPRQSQDDLKTVSKWSHDRIRERSHLCPHCTGQHIIKMAPTQDMENLVDRSVFETMEHFKHDAANMIDSVSKELDELQEKLCKLNVHAQMLEVDIATQFSPDAILEMKKLEQKCLESVNASKELTDQTFKLVNHNVSTFQ